MIRKKCLKKVIAFSLILILMGTCLQGCRGKCPVGDAGAEKDLPAKSRRVVATSVAVAEITDRLGIELVGVVSSKTYKLPKRYKGVQKVGSAMNPDMEIIKALEPDIVLTPASLMGDLLPKYINGNVDYGFLNLSNVEGMYKSIDDLGVMFGRETEAQKMRSEYEQFKKSLKDRIDKQGKKKVLILMGLPGAYVVATDKSYVGSLAKMAGAENVYTDSKKQFLNVNVEDMIKQDPDIILRTSHAMPEDVKKMFAKEFETNDTWKNFRAVSDKKVYDLENTYFGMSARFNYPTAIKKLEEIFYD